MDNKQEKTGQDIYRTGSTTPPKSYGGVIAVLLVAVIFLTGVSTALGLLNIRMFKQIRAQEEELFPVSFSREQSGKETAAAADTVVCFPALGIKGQSLSAFYQVYYHLPQGLYITEVTPGSDAAAKGLLPADVLVSVNGQPVTSEQALQEMLAACVPGDTVQLAVCRDDRTKTLEVEIGE